MAQKNKHKSQPKKESVKQYIYKAAYSDNFHVIQIVDGIIENDTIVTYYELDGFLAALKAMGYEKGYFLPEHKLRLNLAKEELEFAQAEYNEAEKHPVHFSEEEKEKYVRITHQTHKGF